MANKFLTQISLANGLVTGGDFDAIEPGDLPLFTSVLAGAVSASGGGTTNFLRADGSWAVAGTGTVTSIVAGAGLTGGTITSTGTLALDLAHANTWTTTQTFTPGADATIPVVIKGNSATQAADLTEWQTSAGVVIASIQGVMSNTEGQLTLRTGGSTTNMTLGPWVANGGGWALIGNGCQISGFTATFRMDGRSGDATLLLDADSTIGGSSMQLSRPNSGWTACRFGTDGGVLLARRYENSYPTLVVQGPPASTNDLTRWIDDLGAVITTVDKVGGWHPPHLADGTAVNDSVYYSTTASKLVYKDAGGTVNNLY